MSTGHQVAMGLRAAYWAMHRAADACLQPLGVTANQFVLLSLLAEEDAVTQQELVTRASSDPNTVRAMLVALEGKRLVARKRHPSDGRARCVTLTERGRRAFGRSWKESESFRERLTAVLSRGEAEALLDVLGRIAETVEPARRGSCPHSEVFKETHHEPSA